MNDGRSNPLWRSMALWIAAALAVLAAWSGASRWSASPAPAPLRSTALETGPGGPILVVVAPDDPHGSYLCEILRNEGFSSFSSRSIDEIDGAMLAAHEVVLLARTDLSDAHVRLLDAWVRQGGNLIAMRPDAALLPTLGLRKTGAEISDAYLKLDTTTPYAAGLVAESIQFHGAADLYELDGASPVARLQDDAFQAGDPPAVSIFRLGSEGGEAAAFSFDLPRSIILTRQGNPEWREQERDGIPPLRSDDLFYGNANSDPQPDWVDFEKIAIPQADEQQRLLANLILLMNSDATPLPRFWYFPSFHRAVVLMTGDHHGCCSNTVSRFERYVEQSPAGCSVDDWECVRASAYVYPNEHLEEVDVDSWRELGFEIGVHVDTGCQDWDPETLDERQFTPQLTLFAERTGGRAAPVSERTHCIAWSDWSTHARVMEAHGIRLDTNYYYWPPEWVRDRPGVFTGSAMAMRYADLRGSMIDVYQVTTQMTDESEQSYPETAEMLLDRALGPEGYFGVFAANMHMDASPHPGSDAIVEAALARGVPVVSGMQLLRWLDGRELSAFEAIEWDGEHLRFDLVQGAGARNLMAMLPLEASERVLGSLSWRGEAQEYSKERVKGIEYAIFEARPGRYDAAYEDGGP